MYKKDLKRSIHLRVSEDDMQFLIELSEIGGKSICDVLREFITATKYAYRLGQKMSEEAKQVKRLKENKSI
jgi:hypothetical protein